MPQQTCRQWIRELGRLVLGSFADPLARRAARALKGSSEHASGHVLMPPCTNSCSRRCPWRCHDPPYFLTVLSMLGWSFAQSGTAASQACCTAQGCGTLAGRGQRARASGNPALALVPALVLALALALAHSSAATLTMMQCRPVLTHVCSQARRCTSALRQMRSWQLGGCLKQWKRALGLQCSLRGRFRSRKGENKS